MTKRRVVITGLGTVNPLAQDVAGFWDGLMHGRSGVGPITHFDASAYDSRIGGEVKDFPGPPESHVERREVKRLDMFAQFAVSAAVEAVADSGLQFDQEDPFRSGVVIGSGIGGLGELESQHLRLIEKGPSKVSAFTVPKLMVNAASGNVSILWGLQGPNSATATACASAGHAIADAFRFIRADEAEVIITGGSEAALTRLGLSSFCALRGLSTRNDDPVHASRPWDKGRDGFVLAEGAGVIVLEELEHAKARGAKIYAELLGYGVSGDGSHITAPQPEGKGAAMAMRQALRNAGVAPEQVDYINAHGTSTELGDLAETRAIKAVFGDHAKSGLMVSSTKSFIGHTLGASGGIEAVAVAKCIIENVVHATINLDDPDPECDLDYVPHTPREHAIQVAMSNSFGFGGHNVSLLIGRYTG